MVVDFNLVLQTWGHDMFMKMVMDQNKNTLPDVAKYIIQFHSMYVHHQFNAYERLMDDNDHKWSKVILKNSKNMIYIQKQNESYRL